MISPTRSPSSAPGTILLISCYELGHQPLGLASPVARLRGAGHQPAAVDLAVQPLDAETVRAARFVGISVPMHTALRIGIQTAEQVRAANPDAHICFYGLYASLNAEFLLRDHADSIIGGEYEDALIDAAEAVLCGERVASDGVRTRDRDARPVLARLPFAVPARDALPASGSYARLVRGDAVVPAGYVEASRGCLHTCRHCPITPVYGGRFFVVPREVVLADVRQQVAAGAQHITFGDPDFLNGPGHSMAILRALHAEHPDLTFDATIKVEHILERHALIPELARLGCAFVVSAVESLNDDVLRHLGKGHTRADVVEALRILDDAGIPMRPTFVTFTPWTTAAEYLELLDFVAEQGLIGHIDPIQYAIRLLVPPGSALLNDPDGIDWLGPLDELALSYRWSHPDPRMDALWRAVSAEVERVAGANVPAAQIFTSIQRLAREHLLSEAADRHSPTVVTDATHRRARQVVPYLTESWFC